MDRSPSTLDSPHDRLEAERVFHDQQAAERAESFRTGRADLAFADDAFLDHETWVRPAFTMLGNLRGKHALDYGCGHGMAAVVMARAGATVTAFDLSPGYVAEAQERARANGVRIECTAADGEKLPFADASFDAVWGNAILHHLDLTRAGRELLRVLKPGGVAVFCEPWGGNPLLAFARRRLPYPGKDRTPDEKPLIRRDLAPLRAIFPEVEVRGFQLIGMIRRVWRNRLACSVCDWLDTALLRIVPGLQNWCRYAVIALRKPAT
ncbi:MAG: class I SAM-dependent methyltransferase [Planctomycetaceae bacterium]|nr:class I SAM-dependent methyltransferase [Planctomycetaceae bacterium]